MVHKIWDYIWCCLSKIRVHNSWRKRICPNYEFCFELYEVTQSLSQDILRFRYLKLILNRRRRSADMDKCWYPSWIIHVRVRGPHVEYWSIFQQHIVSSCTNDCFWTIRPSQQEMFQIFFMKKWKNMMPIGIWFMSWMMKISELLLRNEVISTVVSSLFYIKML